MKNERIISPDELSLLRKKLSHQKIVMGTGCFDILHVGHLYFLTEAKKYGDILVVGINSDLSVKKIKGLSRPIVKEDDRLKMLASLRCVDYVFLFEGVSAEEHILQLNPDFFIIGEQSLTLYPEESNAAKIVGAKLVPIKPTQSPSTTSIISNIKD